VRLVLASNGLTTLGGSETYLLTLGRHLQRFGHEVHLMEGPGGSGTLAADAGLLSIRQPGELEGPPDRIIVQDAIVSGEAASAWPEVPQLFVVHSSVHDLQMTSAVPSTVAAYVVLNELTATRAGALTGGRPVIRLTQPVDVGHFTPGDPPRDEPRVLLVFGNNKAAWRFEGLEAACEDRGIEVRRAGMVGDARVSDPVDRLREADIVVGYGRCILEAMACGRTAFVFDRFGSDGWVTAETYPALEASGFNGTAGLDEPGRSEFGAVLDAYDPRWGAVGHDLVFRHHHARTHAVAILEVLEGLGPVLKADPHLSFTLARVWRESWRWEGHALALTGEVDKLRRELIDEQKHCTELTEEVARLRGAATAAAARADAGDAALAELRSSRSYRLASALSSAARPFRRRL